MDDWRDELTDDERRLLDRAEAAVQEWHEGAVDCFQWMQLAARLAELLDTRANDAAE